MVTLGGVIGAVLANVILVLNTEWVFVETPHDDVFEAALTVTATVLGWFVGTWLARRLATRTGLHQRRS